MRDQGRARVITKTPPKTQIFDNVFSSTDSVDPPSNLHTELPSSGMRKEDLSETLINVPCLFENPKTINQTPFNGFHQKFTVINECSMLGFKNHNCWGYFQLLVRYLWVTYLGVLENDFSLKSKQMNACICKSYLLTFS